MSNFALANTDSGELYTVIKKSSDDKTIDNEKILEAFSSVYYQYKKDSMIVRVIYSTIENNLCQVDYKYDINKQW